MALDESAALVAEAKRAASERSFVRILAVVAAALAVLPALLNWLTALPGHAYLGVQYNIDDHMVYAAWMRQAATGHLLFDNRFAVDAQPGLTIHLYFLVLGWIAAIVGIPVAMTLARVLLSVAFVFLLYRLVRRLDSDIYTTKLAMALAVFGGGIGFAVWHTFGNTIQKPFFEPLRAVLLGRLPTDVWQPEGYVFPSMLTSGLFMAALCLILVAFLAFLSAREGWRWVPAGAAAMFLLMNIHSYDVLLVAMVMAGFLVMAAVRRQATAAWIGRALVIGAGALPAALWFLYVFRNDPVFQARAATETFSPNFRQVVFGYLGLMGLGLVGLAVRPTATPTAALRRGLGVALTVGLFLGLFVLARSHSDGYFLGMDAWATVVVLSAIALALMAGDNAAWNLLASWAVIGTVGPYFPALFQRKLSMGLAIPWAILAAIAVGTLTKRLERSTRNMILVLMILALGGSSLLWAVRERELASENVSNTVMHPVYLKRDATAIIRRLGETEGRTVVLAMPGINAPAADEAGQPLVDVYTEPYVPDLNPFLSGLAGVHTYAGHWSETPKYNQRRSEATAFFLEATSDAQRRELIERIGANYIVAPIPQAFPYARIADVSSLGTVVYEGPQFRLVQLR